MEEPVDTSRFVVVLSTAGSEEQAQAIARALVERGLAACVNILPGCRSVYRWQGRVVEDDERVLAIKTTAARFESVRAAIREIHSYEVPEILALPVALGDPDYLDWLGRSVE